MQKKFKTRILVKLNNKNIWSNYFNKTLEEINKLTKREDIIYVEYYDNNIVLEFEKEKNILSKFKKEPFNFYINRNKFGVKTPKQILEEEI